MLYYITTHSYVPYTCSNFLILLNVINIITPLIAVLFVVWITGIANEASEFEYKSDEEETN